MVAPKETSKKVGRYLVYKWDFFDGYYSARADKIIKTYDYTQISVFLAGEQKSLQESKDYKSKTQAQGIYSNLSSEKNISKWIGEHN
jgi:hypothetical protein